MIDAIYSRGWLIQRLRRGLLGSHIDRFATLLLEQGYAPDTTEKKIKLVADLGRWLEGKRRRLIWLDEEKVEAFLRARQRRPKFRLGERATMRLLLDQLRSSGDLPVPRPKPEGSSLDFALGEYTDYLVRERGLSQRTVGQYTHWIRTFLAERFDGRAQLFAQPPFMVSPPRYALTSRFCICAGIFKPIWHPAFPLWRAGDYRRCPNF